MEWNPILVREFRARWRGRGAFGLMLGYVGILAIFMVLSYNKGLASANPNDPWGSMSHLGRQLFRSLTWMQVLGFMLVAPSLTATSIAMEREHGMLEGLQLSPLTPWRIISGKLMAALSFIVLVLLISMPITAICFLLGGVSPTDFLLATLLHFVTGLTCAIIGLCCSAWSRRASTALRMTFAIVIMWGIGTASAFSAAFLRSLVPATRIPTPGMKVLNVFSQTNPIIAISALDPSPLMGRALSIVATSITTDTGVIAIQPWAISLGFQCVLSLILLWSAVRAVRKPFAEQYWIELKKKEQAQAAASSQPRSILKKSPEPQEVVETELEAAPLSDGATPPANKKSPASDAAGSPWWEIPITSLWQFSNPVLQREWRGKFKMRKAPLSVIVGESLMGLAVAYYYCQALNWALFNPPARQVVWWVLALIALIVIGLGCAIAGASAFTREREGETWQALSLSQLTPSEIIRGKLIAPLLACIVYSLPLWPLLIPCIRTLQYGGDLTVGVSATQAITTLLVICSMAWCYTTLGMFISWRFQRMAPAIGWTLTTLFLLHIFLPIFLFIIAHVNPLSISLRLWHPFFALLPVVDPHRFRLFSNSMLMDGLLISTTLTIIGALLLWSLHNSMHASLREKDYSAA